MSDMLALAAALDNHANALRELATAVANAPSAPAAQPEPTKPVRQSRARQQAEAAEEAPKAEETSALNYDADVKPLVMRVGKEKNREGLMELFSGFKTADGKVVDHGSKLQPKDYGRFVEAAQLVLSAEEPADEEDYG